MFAADCICGLILLKWFDRILYSGVDKFQLANQENWPNKSMPTTSFVDVKKIFVGDEREISEIKGWI